MSFPLIAQLGLESSILHGETVIVTGSGGGIGLEAARALLWLGANVVIVEINTVNGEMAAEKLAAEFDPERVAFFQTDVGDETSVQKLYRDSVGRFGKVDVVINNATIAVLGKVVNLAIEDWDRSYNVNLRGPVLMAKTFLPDMISRNHGVFICVSSTGTSFLGGYETFKAAQVHLATTLDAELEGTYVNALTISPGLVPTETASKAVEVLATQMGMTVEAFFEMNKNAIVSVEEAGAGFAAAVVFAEKFRGQEISSIQTLKAADINYGSKQTGIHLNVKDHGARLQAKILSKRVYQTLKEQSQGWKERNLFERQWVIRDFKKTAGMPVEEWLRALETLIENMEKDDVILPPPLDSLARYYDHLAVLAKGYEKDTTKLKENLQHIYGWRDEVRDLINLLQ